MVVYKVDRLTRSLTDFAKLVELFDAHGVSFVSVTQAFNTTNSMGRLTLNVLLSFAQFEREVTGERIRDKVAASKRKGMWMGGGVPLGYINRDKKLIIVPEEAETVRWIFRTYLEAGSIGRLLQRMEVEQVRSKRREPGDGRGPGGCRFGPGSLGYLLRNRCYVGEIAHKGQIHAGDHEPIVDRELFDAVQAQLQSGAVDRKLKHAGHALSAEGQAVRQCWKPHDALTQRQEGRPLPLLRLPGHFGQPPKGGRPGGPGFGTGSGGADRGVS